jgi:hypothetical protein
MTYRQLLSQLHNLSEEQLDMDVTVGIGMHRDTQIDFEDSCEFYAVKGFDCTYDQEAATLDPDHPYLAVHM